MFRKISQFIAEVKGELKKTTWPWESDPKVKGFKNSANSGVPLLSF